MRIDVVTIFPGMLQGFFGQSILRRAAAMGAADIRAVDLRDFAHDARGTLDDKPYGGGAGMLMKPEPLFEAVESLRRPGTRVIAMSPQGRPFRQETARRLAQESHLVFLCGHYEGIDERVLEILADEQLSIGDYVLTNGALPAAVVTDAVVRLLPGVLGGGEEATEHESFEEDGLLEQAQYTRPPVWRGQAVPPALLRGDHAQAARWRKNQMLDRTARHRPDLKQR
ncbi:MAG TPA: tRNA (guanosine(37)-N1)-methyltransferase TrmD [Candidatus Spyradenecus faecavium]|uniref:tRNA (guanine-N(1)-)-methyltransferase n=1 Tax=Candidatus Spyradenecus faecavium TaxID=2840947 RepID=A0A9D1T2A2_9BACT|nr:tRNA (guanosine(37)-N1)-methyltransferase TrmD [Candidatus Spyradenecus faecavium]